MTVARPLAAFGGHLKRLGRFLFEVSQIALERNKKIGSQANPCLATYFVFLNA